MITNYFYILKRTAYRSDYEENECVCVCACVRACVRVCVCVCVWWMGVVILICSRYHENRVCIASAQNSTFCSLSVTLRPGHLDSSLIILMEKKMVGNGITALRECS